jgi:hypothetical protein
LDQVHSVKKLKPWLFLNLKTWHDNLVANTKWTCKYSENCIFLKGQSYEIVRDYNLGCQFWSKQTKVSQQTLKFKNRPFKSYIFQICGGPLDRTSGLHNMWKYSFWCRTVSVTVKQKKTIQSYRHRRPSISSVVPKPLKVICWQTLV